MGKVSNIERMHDIATMKPNHARLLEVASEQHGYFTTAQTRASGFRSNLLAHHARTGTFLHVAPGIYRLRDYPPSPYEDIAAAWLAAGKERAVVSHETALDLLDLSNVIPKGVHLTVPRAKRYLSPQLGAIIHTTTRPLRPSDIVIRYGIRTTSPLRTILDAAEAGTGPEQIEMAIRQALQRGMLDREQLVSMAAERSGRVQRLVQRTLEKELAGGTRRLPAS
jgi:predicted transcriptional regulator of viral defense system